MMKKCKYCKKTFKDLTPNHIRFYCYGGCQTAIRNFKKKLKRLEKVKILKLKCPECKKLFTKKSSENKKYCTVICGDRFNGRKFHKKRLHKLKNDIEFKKKFYAVRNKWIEKNKDKIKISLDKSRAKPEYKEKRKKYLKIYMSIPKNREKRKIYMKKLYWEHGYKEKKAKYKKENRDKIRKQSKEYYTRPEIKKQMAKYRKYKFKTDPVWIVRSRIRTRFYTHIKKGMAEKKVKTLDLIGCDWLFLKNHLEKKFKKNMNWNNYGKWHIDHIKPMSHFNLFDVQEQKNCFHYSNLQPLWAVENLRKGNRYVG